MNQLILCRAVQGAGGAWLVTLAFVVLADLFPPAERGKYQGLLVGVFGLASLAVPVLGGWLTDHGTGLLPGVAGWRLVFYVNLPLGLLALWFILFILAYMPPGRAPATPSAVDWMGALLLVSGVGLFVVALQLDRARYGWLSPLPPGLLGGAGLALGLFGWRSRSQSSPLLDVALLAQPLVRAAASLVFLLGGVFLSLLVFTPLLLVRVLGESGTGLLPMSLGVGLSSFVSGQLVARYGHYTVWLRVGALLLLAGVSGLALLPGTATYAQVVSCLAVCGLGLGPVFPLTMLAVQNATAPAQLGQATAAMQFARQLGSVLIAALLGAVLTLALARAWPATGAHPLAIEMGGGEGASPASAPVEADSPAQHHALAQALRQVERCLVAVAVGGLLLTFLIPERPLRRHHEEEEARS